MAISWLTGIRLCGCLNKFIALNLRAPSDFEMPPLRYFNSGMPCFSTSVLRKHPSSVASTRDVLLEKLEIAVKENEVEAALAAFYGFRRLYGYPAVSTMSRLIMLLKRSTNRRWLQAAFELLFTMARRKQELVHHDDLTRICLLLSRAQMSVPASRILRLMLHRHSLPPFDVLHTVVLHLVKTEVGTCLASNILIEICDCFLKLRVKNPELSASLKPRTMIFNLVLDACVNIGSLIKGKQVIEAMARIGVVGDAHSILLFARVCEMNFERDELKKFQIHIDRVSIPLVDHHRYYYDSLLSLHYKFDDLDAVASLVANIYKSWESRPLQVNKDLKKPCFVHIGSKYLREGLKFQIMPELLEKDSVISMELDGKHGLVLSTRGKLGLSSKGLAQLMLCYKRNRRITELSKLLVSIQKELGTFEESNLCIDVVDACIHIGWLDTAHDIVEDMELAGASASIPSSTYLSLLRAYCVKNMIREAKVLATQMKRADLLSNLSREVDICRFVSEIAIESGPNTDPAPTVRKSILAECLIQEMKAENSMLPSMIHELNSAIYFFCKAKMIDDGLMTYRRMQELNIKPSEQTFAYLIQGYSSLEMHRQITILWGNIKRNTELGYLVPSRDLYEMLLMNFIRGGYFERTLEVIDYMKERGMYMDKWICKNEFLMFHRNLYRRLDAMDAKDEVQRQRIEHVRAFRKWLSSD
ncbi:hypothetical protein Dimus_019478 [Dionaea muscipula]